MQRILRTRHNFRLCLMCAADCQKHAEGNDAESAEAKARTRTNRSFVESFSHTTPRASIHFDEQKARKKAKKEAAAAAKAAAAT